MRALIFVFALVLTSYASAQDIEIPCGGSPSKAVLNVPQPADRFLHVLCTRFGHILTPTATWFWTRPGTVSAILFPAQMVRQDPKESGHAIYFNSIVVSPLNGKATQEKWSLLGATFPNDVPPEKALEVVAENNSGERHLIYIFSNAWGYSCSPACRSENAFIMISQGKVMPQW